MPLGIHSSQAREGRRRVRQAEESRPSVVSQEGLDLSAPLFFAAGMAVGQLWRRPVKRTPCLPLRHRVTGSWDEGKAKAAGQKSRLQKQSFPWAYEKPFGLRQIQGKGKDLGLR